MECFILKSERIGEADHFVTALLADGRRREAIARAASVMSSRLRGGVLPVGVSDASFVVGRRNWILRSARPIMTFPAFRNSLATRASTTLLLEMVAEGTRDVEDSELYLTLTRLLRDLHTAVLSKEGTLALTRRMAAAWLRIHQILGFAPVLDQCTSCEKKEQLTVLSPSSSGALCSVCAMRNQDHRSLSLPAMAELASRRIPEKGSDVAQLIRFLTRFTAWNFPALGPRALWVEHALIGQTPVPSRRSRMV